MLTLDTQCFLTLLLLIEGNGGLRSLVNKLILLYISAAACTFIAGVLHLALIPMFFGQMPIDVTIFFLVSGLAQIFWVIPTVQRWSKPWFYVGIGGTVILIIMYFVAVPGSGYPISPLDIAIETFQIIFVILCSIIIFKDMNRLKVNKQNIWYSYLWYICKGLIWLFDYL